MQVVTDLFLDGGGSEVDHLTLTILISEGLKALRENRVPCVFRFSHCVADSEYNLILSPDIREKHKLFQKTYFNFVLLSQSKLKKSIIRLSLSNFSPKY